MDVVTASESFARGRKYMVSLWRCSLSLNIQEDAHADALQGNGWQLVRLSIWCSTQHSGRLMLPSPSAVNTMHLFLSMSADADVSYKTLYRNSSANHTLLCCCSYRFQFHFAAHVLLLVVNMWFGWSLYSIYVLFLLLLLLLSTVPLVNSILAQAKNTAGCYLADTICNVQS